AAVDRLRVLRLAGRRARGLVPVGAAAVGSGPEGVHGLPRPDAERALAGRAVARHPGARRFSALLVGERDAIAMGALGNRHQTSGERGRQHPSDAAGRSADRAAARGAGPPAFSRSLPDRAPGLPADQRTAFVSVSRSASKKTSAASRTPSSGTRSPSPCIEATVSAERIAGKRP